MKSFVRNRVSNVALFAGVVAAAWSPASFACSDTPVLASICIMAVPVTFGPFNRQYILAAGQDLSINNYTALYSLIGTTYSQTNNSTTFKLPDLRGRFVIAADGVNYKAGDNGGNSRITLGMAQLPKHSFKVNAIPVALNLVTVTTPLPELKKTVAIGSSVATGTVSGLQLNVVGGSGGATAPSGNYLGKSTSPLVNLYSSATPDAKLNAGSISGGDVSVTVPASSFEVSFPGSNVAGVVGGTATASGDTNILGEGGTIDIRPPFIALTYYIAVQNGLYPSRD